jgi:hypothetical protein
MEGRELVKSIQIMVLLRLINSVLIFVCDYFEYHLTLCEVPRDW